MKKYQSFSIGRRNLDKENNWEELDIKKYKITKPTVICLSGTGSVCAKDANRMCKLAENLIGAKDKTCDNEFATKKDVEFVGISYGKINKFDSNGFLSKDERDLIIKNIFEPLYCDKNGDLLSKNDMAKNFNKITFFAYCYGAHEVSEFVYSVYGDILKRGLDEVTANEVMDQMFAVAYAPTEVCACPSLQVFSAKDQNNHYAVEKGNIFANKGIQNLYDNKFGQGTRVYKESDYTASIITSALTRNWSGEHSILLVDRDEDWKYVEEYSAFGDEVSQVMGNALAMSVANSIQNTNSEIFIPKPTIDDVIEQANSILGETKESESTDCFDQIK